MLDHSKIWKMPFWMIQIAKNEVFDHFPELGALDRLQIAYYDYTKWSWQFGCHILHARSFKNHKNAFLNDPKSQKLGFWPFSGVWSVRSTWHRILWKNYMLSTHFLHYRIKSDHLKIKKNAFMDDAKGQKWGFWQFSSVRCIGYDFKLNMKVKMFNWTEV